MQVVYIKIIGTGYLNSNGTTVELLLHVSNVV